MADLFLLRHVCRTARLTNRIRIELHHQGTLGVAI
jgi:hypothetical protein